MAIPLVGSINWVSFFIGVLFSYFALPLILGLVRSKSAPAPAQGS